MDPWLEASWGDFHTRLILYACDQLESRLPEGLFAAVEETVTIAGETPDEWNRARPDVAAFERPSASRSDPRVEGGGVAVAEPLRIHILPQPIVETRIEIRRVGGDERVVTAIEMISRTNKLDQRSREAYLTKRSAYYAAGVNVVEIDLLRDGEPLLDIPREYITQEQQASYTACAYRAPAEGEERWVAEFYRLPLRQRLPGLRIPLRPADHDVVLDLQAVVDEAYRRGRYGTRLDYTKPPRPPLSPEDAQWAAELVRTARGAG